MNRAAVWITWPPPGRLVCGHRRFGSMARRFMCISPIDDDRCPIHGRRDVPTTEQETRRADVD